MAGDLARFGMDWSDMADEAADWQAALLRRTASEMRLDFDAVAMFEVERGTIWRPCLRNPRWAERGGA